MPTDILRSSTVTGWQQEGQEFSAAGESDWLGRHCIKTSIHESIHLRLESTLFSYRNRGSADRDDDDDRQLTLKSAKKPFGAPSPFKA